MDRKNFIKTTSLATIGAGFGLPLFPQKVEANIFVTFLSRLAAAVVMDLAASTVSDYIKDTFWSDGNKETIHSTNEQLNSNGYSHTSSYSSVRHYGTNDYDFAYTAVKQSRSGDIFSTQTPFISNKPQRVGVAAVLRDSELAAITLLAEKLRNDYSAEEVKQVLLPRLVTSRAWANNGDEENGSIVFNSDKGKIGIGYKKITATQIKMDIDFAPTRFKKYSRNLFEKELMESFVVKI